MRVTDVELYSSSLEEPISFSLRTDEPLARYQIRTILGLDAEEIIKRFYGTSSSNKKYYDFKMKPRDIVIRAVLNPQFIIDESYSDIRDELYRAISANRDGIVTLYFRSGETIVSTIKGSISKFEVPYFVKLPEVQITVNCEDPMFRALNPVSFTPAELGESNPILIPDNYSTAPHGFRLQVTFTAASPSFTIEDTSTVPEWKFKIIPSGGFLSGDELHISTELADKQVYIIRSSSTIQLADKIEPGSLWPVIFHGQNEFKFIDLTKFDWDLLEHYAAYWGV